MRVDLTDTNLSGRTFEEVRFDGQHPNDWHVCKVENNVFTGACGPYRLGEVIAVFLKWAG